MSEYKNPDYSPPRSEDELIQRYQKGERYFGETELDKETIDFREACLEDIIFTPRSFLTADFRNAKLMGADFSDLSEGYKRVCRLSTRHIARPVNRVVRRPRGLTKLSL